MSTLTGYHFYGTLIKASGMAAKVAVALRGLSRTGPRDGVRGGELWSIVDKYEVLSEIVAEMRKLVELMADELDFPTRCEEDVPNEAPPLTGGRERAGDGKSKGEERLPTEATATGRLVREPRELDTDVGPRQRGLRVPRVDRD